MANEIYIDFSSQTENTREPYEDDSWDRGDTATSWMLNGLYAQSKPKGYFESITVLFDVEPGMTVYPVWAVWSTGDSFGHDSGAHAEVFDVFLTYEKAMAAKKVLQEAKDYYAVIVREDGTKMQISIPWNGYFESLDYVSVDMETVK